VDALGHPIEELLGLLQQGRELSGLDPQVGEPLGRGLLARQRIRPALLEEFGLSAKPADPGWESTTGWGMSERS